MHCKEPSVQTANQVLQVNIEEVRKKMAALGDGSYRDRLAGCGAGAAITDEDKTQAREFRACVLKIARWRDYFFSDDSSFA